MDDVRLVALLEKEQIRELFARLVRAMDRADETGIAACYTSSSYDDHGSFAGTGAEFAARPDRDEYAARSHLLGQSIIDLRGDEAFCETYVYSTVVREVGDELFEIQITARYLDRVVKVDGDWLIHYRRVVLDWANERPALPRAGNHRYQRSKRWPDDAVYHPEAWGPLPRERPRPPGLASDGRPPAPQ